MKKLILSLFLGMCAFGLFAQTTSKPTIVVIPFDVKGVSEEEADVLFEVFQSEFANTGKAKIVDRSSLEKIKTQQDFQNSDWSNTDKVAEMGKALNASMVVTGQIMIFKSNLVTTIKLIDVNTTEIISSVVEKTTSTDDLFNKLPDMAKQLAKKLNFAAQGKRYEIGDVGPGGGLVFYVDEDGFEVYDGLGGVQICYYFEMAEFSIGNSYWAPPGSEFEVGVYNSEKIGYGKSNTYNIVQLYKNKNPSPKNCAAYACYMYKTETTKEGDWFLPSRRELELLYDFLPERLRVADKNQSYWSSSDSKPYGYSSYENGKYKYYDTNVKLRGYDKKLNTYIYYRSDGYNPYMHSYTTEDYKYEDTLNKLVRPIRAF